MDKIVENLVYLGLSRQDAKVYLSLLKLGEERAGKIIEDTSFHREIVYSALGRLEREGLVQAASKKRIKYFHAIPPKELIKKIEEKAKTAREMLPTLEKMYVEQPLEVRILEGPEGYEEVQQDIQDSLKNGDKFYVIGGSGDEWYKVTAGYYKKYQKRLIKRGIKMLTVTSQIEAEGIAKYEDPRVNPIRVMPANFSSPSSTLFYADKVIIQIFGESPVAVMIKSKAVSEAYKHYFDTLWQLSEEFKY